MININKISKKISISILNCSPFKLFELLKNLKKNKINNIHFDVMDGHFVDNISFGHRKLKSIVKEFENYFIVDCHMMVDLKKISYKTFLQPYIDLGVNTISLHYEAINKSEIFDIYNHLKAYSVGFGLVINPNTKLTKELLKTFSYCRIITLMSVFPGKGGQKFIENTYNKAKTVKNYLKENDLKVVVQVDGGVNGDNIAELSKSGVNYFVVGSFLTKSSGDQILFESKIKKLLNLL